MTTGFRASETESGSELIPKKSMDSLSVPHLLWLRRGVLRFNRYLLGLNFSLFRIAARLLGNRAGSWPGRTVLWMATTLLEWNRSLLAWAIRLKNTPK